MASAPASDAVFTKSPTHLILVLLDLLGQGGDGLRRALQLQHLQKKKKKKPAQNAVVRAPTQKLPLRQCIVHRWRRESALLIQDLKTSATHEFTLLIESRFPGHWEGIHREGKCGPAAELRHLLVPCDGPGHNKLQSKPSRNATNHKKRSVNFINSADGPAIEASAL